MLSRELIPGGGGGGGESQPVHGDDSSSTQPDVVLKPHFGSWHLASVGHAPQLPAQFSALRQSRRPQGVALGDEPPTGIDHILPTVSVVSPINHLPSLA